MDYTVSKGAPGKRKVSLRCPKCGEGLKTPLESAGQPVDCPTCGHGLIIPGVPELDAQIMAVAEAERARAAAKAQQAAQLAAAAATPATIANSPTQSPPPPAASSAIVPSPPLAYSTPGTPAVRVPTYAGLSIAGSVLAVYAGLLYVGGVIVFGVAIYAYSKTSSASPFGSQADLTVVLTPGVVVLFFGAMAHGASAALKALRDIAINSFR